MSDSSKRTEIARRAWRRGADRYDAGIAGAERGLLRGGREWIGGRATGRVLEVAVGTGRSLPFYPDDVVLAGIDLSPEMLAHARTRAAESGREVALVEGDAEHLPFADASFDTVLCALGLCAIPDAVAAVAEMRRVLVPGGRLLLLDHVRSTVAPVLALQWLVERVTIRTSGEHFTRRPLDLLRADGWEVVESERTKAGVVEKVHARRSA